MTKSEYYQIGRFAYDHGWALTHFLLKSKDNKYNQVVPNYFYTMQSITFPLLDRLAKLGENVSSFDSIIERDWDDIEDLEDLEDELDEMDEEAKEREKKRKERRELNKQLDDAMNVASEKAFDGIDRKKLHEDFTGYFR